jgi:hypothetical protein
MIFKYSILIIPALLVLMHPIRISAQSEEEAILDSVQSFFDGLAERNVDKLSSVLLSDGIFISVREQEGAEWVVRSEAVRMLLESITGREDSLFERMWEPEVLIHGRIAVVWTPYDFYVDKKFSHCGMDAFNMVKTDTGWKIASALYTVERTGCGESPLGPPLFNN